MGAPCLPFRKGWRERRRSDWDVTIHWWSTQMERPEGPAKVWPQGQGRQMGAEREVSESLLWRKVPHWIQQEWLWKKHQDPLGGLPPCPEVLAEGSSPGAIGNSSDRYWLFEPAQGLNNWFFPLSVTSLLQVIHCWRSISEFFVGFENATGSPARGLWQTHFSRVGQPCTDRLLSVGIHLPALLTACQMPFFFFLLFLNFFFF